MTTQAPERLDQSKKAKELILERRKRLLEMQKNEAKHAGETSLLRFLREKKNSYL